MGLSTLITPLQRTYRRGVPPSHAPTQPTHSTHRDGRWGLTGASTVAPNRTGAPLECPGGLRVSRRWVTIPRHLCIAPPKKKGGCLTLVPSFCMGGLACFDCFGGSLGEWPPAMWFGCFWETNWTPAVALWVTTRCDSVFFLFPFIWSGVHAFCSLCTAVWFPGPWAWIVGGDYIFMVCFQFGINNTTFFLQCREGWCCVTGCPPAWQISTSAATTRNPNMMFQPQPYLVSFALVPWQATWWPKLQDLEILRWRPTSCTRATRAQSDGRYKTRGEPYDLPRYSRTGTTADINVDSNTTTPMRP